MRGILFPVARIRSALGNWRGNTIVWNTPLPPWQLLSRCFIITQSNKAAIRRTWDLSRLQKPPANQGSAGEANRPLANYAIWSHFSQGSIISSFPFFLSWNKDHLFPHWSKTFRKASRRFVVTCWVEGSQHLGLERRATGCCCFFKWEGLIGRGRVKECQQALLIHACYCTAEEKQDKELAGAESGNA